ncbi:hypothetical protein K474DRAFT_125683 [Panus rudis PR-1116 ss-1]|nr:hypothetical protein K474DRAFT_125683 [Panus rudis PR-1116 ss-1]
MENALKSLPPSLLNVLAAYASLTPPKFIEFPENISFAEAQEFFLKHLLLNKHFEKYPPSKQYDESFWKWAVEKLEKLAKAEGAEIDEQIYDRYLTLMSLSSPLVIPKGPPDASYLTYVWKTPDGAWDHATVLESRTTIEEGTTGLKTWPASLILAEYLIQNPELVAGKKVLELGCGAGLLGIITASLQQTAGTNGSLYLTDVRPDVLRRCESNVVLPCNKSSQHSNVHYELLNWADAISDSTAGEVKDKIAQIAPDIVLGADVLFDPSDIPALVKVLDIALQSLEGTRQALIALTIRNADTVKGFLDAAGQQLEVEELQLPPSNGIFLGVSQERKTDIVKIYKLQYTK